MLNWMLPLFLLLTATPSPMPTPAPLPLIGDELTLTIAAEVFALMAAEDDAFHLLSRPLPTFLEPLRLRSLVWGVSEEQRLIRSGWRFWGLREHDPDDWGSYPEDAWVIARHTLARGEPLGVGDLKLLGGAGLQVAEQEGAVVVATGANLGAEVTVALSKGGAPRGWLGGEGLLAQQQVEPSPFSVEVRFGED
ncbi:MAG: hypothetical protein SNJ54_15695 [Anaerolineae bacterium]